MNKLFVLLFLVVITFVPVFAQDQSTQQPTQQPTPTTEELEKAQAEKQKNAYRLLDQIIDEAQSLRLPENRVRVQTTAADMLWDSNQGRARSLFSMAAESVAEMGRQQQQQNNTNRRPGPQNVERRAFQLRQDLVMAAARHDAQLAYQLLAITKPAALPAPTGNDPRLQRVQGTPEDNLEQMLLGRIAAIDPKFAAQNAEQMMDKGQFPRSLTEVLNNLFMQDYDAAAKLADKTATRLQTTNLLTNPEAAGLAQALLVRGPRSAEKPRVIKVTGQAMLPVLGQASYTELLGNVIDTILKVTPPTPQNTPRGQAQRGRPAVVSGIGPGTSNVTVGMNEQVEQNSARRLLAGLQVALPLIDQYAPSKSAAVRQKLTEMGLGTITAYNNITQTMSALQGNPTTDALIQAAATAPPQMQPRLYQQAAF
ncbi:MAG TPA: hypothetical protein VN844_11235, partial [Pyrinomonadaceae bacterium]|nr:hypothetical protein [Pyrinomonadaceae bacterium]